MGGGLAGSARVAGADPTIVDVACIMHLIEAASRISNATPRIDTPSVVVAVADTEVTNMIEGERAEKGIY
jgi:hypothetical protein